jgi:hypothetical protein
MTTEGSPESKHTAGAQRALGLAQLVNKVFASERIPSTLAAHGGYRVEMSGPDALSTSERKGARDHLNLVPADPEGTTGGGAAAILIATADPNLSQLELRSYDYLKQLHAERFKGEALPIDAAAYAALRKKLEEFFERQGIATVSSESRTSITSPPAAMTAAKSGPPVLVLVIAGVVVLLAVAFFVLRSK